MDPLSDVLSLLKLRSYMAGGFDHAGDWSVHFGCHEGIKCYALVSGHCWLAVEGVPDAIRMEAGDCILLPRGLPFRLASDLSLPSVDALALFTTPANGDIRTWNGGGECFTVVRGGFGISYYPAALQNQTQAANPPYYYQSECIPCLTVHDTSAFWPTFPTPAAASTTTPSGTLVWVNKNFNTSYVQQFNLMVQQQVGANVITLGGVGELARHQLFQPDANMPAPSGTSTEPKLLTAATNPLIDLVTDDSARGTSNYYALQAVFTRRFTKGLAFNANYTWAHGLSDAVSSSAGAATGMFQITNNARYDYGNSSINIGQRLATSLDYQLPFGKDTSGGKAVLLKGWESNVIVFWQSGLPFTVSDSHDQINLPTITADRPNVTGAAYKASSSPGINNWLNLAAFTPQAIGNPGNEGNESLSGPHMRRADLSIFKNFKVTEKLSAQFRAECYNISNTPNFANPNAAISDWINPSTGAVATTEEPGDTASSAGEFGKITETQLNLNPRQFQFALKLLF